MSNRLPFRERAQLARAEYRRAKGLAAPPRDRRPARPTRQRERPDRNITKRGQRCPSQNPGWSKLVVSVAKVVASGKVPGAVYEMRMGKCHVCPYCTIMNGRHYCGCCNCPMWNVGKIGSHLEYKNAKPAWACPRPDPAFGPV